ncbi:hypothetical protein Sjap_016512 [Stephania japonica]|uniref:Bifunctional inhibitor/plant lipid transfer protein/seed storage helical domain-containing protein n=1 Tax=Stephania japonica TaxID=461633 RepID=A0AAP0NTV5_9MAGN
MMKFVVVVVVVVVVMLGRVSYCAEPTVAEQCNNEFTKLGVCLDYATGKADSPSPVCCSTVKQIREANEVCLCYVIQMTHKGEASLKQMGLQEEKLFQLSSACKLANTSIADCPKLLNIPSSSPDAAIFTKTNSSSSSPATANPTASTTPSSKNEKSDGALRKTVVWIGPIVVTTIATMFM